MGKESFIIPFIFLSRIDIKKKSRLPHHGAIQLWFSAEYGKSRAFGKNKYRAIPL
jgi:hypothetical protein